MHQIKLIPLSAEDEELAVRIECDPLLMAHIGGPRPEPDVRAAHKRRLDLMNEGRAIMYTIVSEISKEVLGTIGLWQINGPNSQTFEMGWFVLPEYQGRGVATKAAHQILSEAGSNPEICYVHAFPSISNSASNAIAGKIGMENLGEFDNEGFAGVLRCNNWRINLREKKH